MRDIYHNIKVTQMLSPVVATTTKTSATVDLKGFDSAVITFDIGQSGDTLSGSVYWTLAILHSDDDSSYSAVVAAELSNGANSVVVDSASLDETAHNFGYVGSKRYLRATATPSGTHTNGTPMGIVAVRGTPSYMPAM
jgi:hypothetical protein